MKGSADRGSERAFFLRPTRFNEPRDRISYTTTRRGITIFLDLGERSSSIRLFTDFPVVFYSSPMKNFSTDPACVIFSPLCEGESFFFHKWIDRREGEKSLNLFLLLRCPGPRNLERVDLQRCPPFFARINSLYFLFKKVADPNSELFFIFRPENIFLRIY